MFCLFIKGIVQFIKMANFVYYIYLYFTHLYICIYTVLYILQMKPSQTHRKAGNTTKTFYFPGQLESNLPAQCPITLSNVYNISYE